MALIGCFLEYDGREYIALVEREVAGDEPQHSAFDCAGDRCVILLYLLADAAYLKVLPLS